MPVDVKIILQRLISFECYLNLKIQALRTSTSDPNMNGDGDRSPSRSLAQTASNLHVGIAVGRAAEARVQLRAAAITPAPVTGPWHDLHVVLELTGRCRLDDEPIVPGRDPIAPCIPLIPHHLQVVPLRNIGELLLVDDRSIKCLHPPTGDQGGRTSWATPEILGRDDEFELYIHPRPVGGITAWSFAIWRCIAIALCHCHHTGQTYHHNDNCQQRCFSHLHHLHSPSITEEPTLPHPISPLQGESDLLLYT